MGETIADRQLVTFKKDPGSRGKTCRAGLWHYSRHPNYFFEWILWCGFGVLGLAGPWGWAGLAAPALMLYTIVFVTGIPPTEAQALVSRGEDYRAYQRTTSPFVPWPPREDPGPNPGSFVMWYQGILDRGLVPDGLIRRAIRRRCAERLQRERGRFDREAFVAELKTLPHRPAYRPGQRAALRGAAGLFRPRPGAAP